MPIVYTELTSRQEALRSLLLTASATLGAGLPEVPGVYLGPARETLDGKHFGVFITRRGLPDLAYDMGVSTASWTVEFELALQSYWPESAERLETYCGYLAANVLSVLHANCQRRGDGAWDKGLVGTMDAVRLRREGREGAYEIEVIPFRVTFEVSYR